MATYTVKKGDSLSKIAKRLLGDAGRWAEIAKANGLSGKSILQPGQVLTVGKGSTPPLPRARPNYGPTIPGQLEPGNIDLDSRTPYRAKDGTISTERSISIEEDGKEVLIPTVSADGTKILTNDQAIAQYQKTGKHLGKFKDAATADRYAQALHERQAEKYAPAGTAEAAPAPKAPDTAADLAATLTDPAKQADLAKQTAAEAAALKAQNDAAIDKEDAARAAARKPVQYRGLQTYTPDAGIAADQAKAAADTSAREAAKAQIANTIGPGGSPVKPIDPIAAWIENATGGALGKARAPVDVRTANSPFAAGIDRLPADPTDSATTASNLIAAARAGGPSSVDPSPMGATRIGGAGANFDNANITPPPAAPSPAIAAASGPSGNIITDYVRSLYVPPSANPKGIDPRLVDIAQQAASGFPLKVEVTPHGGKNARSAGTPNHPGGWAMDFQIYDQAGKPLNNFHDPKTFRTYEQFAQKMRQIQMKKYPELDKTMRFGGYFGGGHAFDQMHIDITPSAKGAMAMGSWDGGLNDVGRKYMPNAESIGMAKGGTDTDLLAGTAAPAAKAAPPVAAKAAVAATAPNSLAGLFGATSATKTPVTASPVAGGIGSDAPLAPAPGPVPAPFVARAPASPADAVAAQKAAATINMLAMLQQSMKRTAPIAAPPAITSQPLDPSQIWPANSAWQPSDYPQLQPISSTLYL